MKILALLGSFAIAASYVQAQLPTLTMPEWKVTLKVVDDIGNPVAGAKAVVGFLFTNQIAGLTDTNGIFIASHRDKTFGLGFNLTKEGYYTTHQTYDMGFSEQYNEAKWHPTIEIVLRKIGFIREV